MSISYWFYEYRGKQKGPVDPADFLELIRCGAIAADTLVWHKGLTGWLPLKTVADDDPELKIPVIESLDAARAIAAAEAVKDAVRVSLPPGETCPDENGKVIRCGMCGNPGPMVGPDFQASGTWICESCQQKLLHSINSALTAPRLNLAGFAGRLAAFLLDSILWGLVTLIILHAMKIPLPDWTAVTPENQQKSIEKFITDASPAINISQGFLLLYRGLCFALFGATLGKMTLGIRVVRPDGGKLGFAQSFLRAAAMILSDMTVIGYLIAGFDPEKRTLHDLLAGTRVVRKQTSLPPPPNQPE